jgi:hypothetical protein
VVYVPQGIRGYLPLLSFIELQTKNHSMVNVANRAATAAHGAM